MSAIDGKILAVKSDCYKSAEKMTPKGIVVHSTGANNPNLKRYVAPDDGVIGNNPNNNSFNEPGQDICPHAVIGKDKNGAVKTYQILPFDYCCWGVGSGFKGSYNYNPAYIQFEMCEDGLTDKTYCKAVYDKAVEFCAYICKTYNISADNIVSHHEAGQRGMGSSHVDPDNWWGKHGYTMGGFRKAVKAKLSTTNSTAQTKPTTSTKEIYRVRKSWNDVKSQIGAYSSLENAQKACKTGYSVFDASGKIVYTPTTATTTTSSATAPDITYCVYTSKWLPAVKNYNTTDSNGYAGIQKTSVSGLAVKSSKGTLKYRVHIKGGAWLDWVSKYDTSDWNNGCAGIKGKAIDAIQMKLDGVSGYEVKYRVSTTSSSTYLPWVTGTEDYAGIFGSTIDCIQAVIVNK